MRRAARSARTFEAESLVPLRILQDKAAMVVTAISENMSAVCPAGKAQTGLLAKQYLFQIPPLWAIYEDHTVPTGTKWARELDVN